VPYLRAVDPLPLESAEYNKLHGVYDRLAAGRLATTRCAGCGRLDWPPRGFCPVCGSDAYDWADLPSEGRVHGFSVQETGVPAGYPRPLVFAMVDVAGLRIFAPLLGVGDVAALRIGLTVRLEPLRVADDPQGQPRYLPAFRLDVQPGGPGTGPTPTGTGR
jgi:uncharacterized OB-fold protein